MNYFLFLDDLREYGRDIIFEDIEKTQISIITAKSYESFVQIIEKNGIPNIISFDFDLEPKAYVEFEKGAKRGYLDFSKTGKTGLHCAVWLKGFCKNNNTEFPKYFIHTMNSLGRKYLINFLKSGILPKSFLENVLL